jgi:hypothetical protein
MNKRFSILILMLVFILVIPGCRFNSGSHIPDLEIVFEANRFEEPLTGFINSDGTGREEIKVDHFLTQPIWSSEKQTIFYWEPRGSIGNIETRTGFPYFWIEGRGFKSCPILVGRPVYPFPGSEKDLLVSSGGDIRRINGESCKDIKVYIDYTDPFSRKRIAGLSISRDGQYILYTEQFISPAKTRDKFEFTIKIFDLNTEMIRDIGEGVNAEFSPDNSWVAYTGFDGIYVMKSDGTEKKRLVPYNSRDLTREINDFEIMPPAPRWSPNGEWLIYHKCMNKPVSNCKQTSDFSVFKVHVSSGDETKIFDEGLNPYWKHK